MDAKQITLAQSAWSRMLPISDTATELYYNHLFETDPTTNALSKGNMTAQGRTFKKIITSTVNGLNGIDALIPGVQELSRRIHHRFTTSSCGVSV